jgi:hypothetical protein
MRKVKYCENCFQEELENYVVDSIGGVFCDERCFEEMGSVYIGEYEIVEWIGDWISKTYSTRR